MERQGVLDVLNGMMKIQAGQVKELGGQKIQSSEEFLKYVTEKHKEEMDQLQQEIVRLGKERREVKNKQKEIQAFLDISQRNLLKARSEIEEFSDIRD